MKGTNERQKKEGKGDAKQWVKHCQEKLAAEGL